MFVRSFSLAFVLGLAVASAFATRAQAVVVSQPSADIAWSAAPGDVVDYGVWVVPEGATPPAAPTLRVAATNATILGTFGTTVRVRVAAYYAGDVVGPFSPDSEPIRFRAPAPAPYDLDGDGIVDRVLREEESGELMAMLVDGLATRAVTTLDRGAQPDLQVSGSADFDGDGLADLVAWDPMLGAAELWTMNGTQVQSRAAIATLGMGWYARALGDANADGTTRLLWRDLKSGEVQLWSMDGAQVVSQAAMLPLDPAWRLWASCDLDANGYRDLVWVDPARLRARVWLLDDGDSADEYALPHPGKRWFPQACGDVDGDGREVLVWQRNADLKLWKLASLGTNEAYGTLREQRGPRRVDLAQAGDFDADGDADLLYLRPQDAVSLTCFTESAGFACDRMRLFSSSGSWQISSW